MSHSAPEEEQGSPLAVEPEDEQYPIPTIAAVAVVAAVVFTVGVLWAVHLMRGVASEVAKESGPPVEAADIGKPEIGMVDQTLYSREERAQELKEEKARQLESYGWVSRKNGIIHIPIDEAMKAVAQGKRPPGAGATQPPPSPLPPVPPPPGVQGPPGPAALTGATGGAGPNNSNSQKP
jgi:hypothetical protein